nr:nuclear egress lamina protein [Macronycteris gammaherpesvirus 1]BEG23144.1 nuclear egress lamina protein [Macronycteris gammaherpesvirus 1]
MSNSLGTPSVKSFTSKKSKRSIKKFSFKERQRYHPYRNKSVKSLHNPQTDVSIVDFFNGISCNIEFGKDFLREMDTPICTSKTICLPLDLDKVAPGRCLLLSPLEHTCNMGFHCEHCTKAKSCSSSKIGIKDDFNSVTLTFYNCASKVVQNKNFYLSLLSHSLSAVKQSFAQPSLLYAYVVLRTICEDVFPIFQVCGSSLQMYTLFKSSHLHIGVTCLRFLVDNLINYKVTLDCIKQTYVLKFFPLTQETNTMTVQETEICEAVTSLDYTDEIKQEISSGQELVADF